MAYKCYMGPGLLDPGKAQNVIHPLRRLTIAPNHKGNSSLGPILPFFLKQSPVMT